MKKYLSIVFILLLVTFLSVSVLAHPGRTDSNGGHQDGDNVSELGTYHYHHRYEAHLHDNDICSYLEASTYSSSDVSTTQVGSTSPQEAPPLADGSEIVNSGYNMAGRSIPALLFDIIATALIYLTVPTIIVKTSKNPFSKSASCNIALACCVGSYLVFFALYQYLNMNQIPKIPVAVFWWFVIYKMLKSATPKVHTGELQKPLDYEQKIISTNTSQPSTQSDIPYADVQTQFCAANEPPTHRNVRTVYCKKCGALLDTDRHCVQCGARYFKFPNAKGIFTSPLLLWTIIVALSVSTFYFFAMSTINYNSCESWEIKSYELQSDIETQQDEIDIYRRQVAIAQDDIRLLQEKNLELFDKAYTLDTRIAFTTSAGSKYHTWDCHYLQNSDSFWAYNVEQAIGLGYAACSVCH